MPAIPNPYVSYTHLQVTQAVRSPVAACCTMSNSLRFDRSSGRLWTTYWSEDPTTAAGTPLTLGRMVRLPADTLPARRAVLGVRVSRRSARRAAPPAPPVPTPARRPP